MTRWLPLLVCSLLTLAVGCGGDDAGGTPSGSEPPTESNPLAGKDLWVNPEGHAVQQVEAWEEQNRGDLAELLQPMAEQPTATWFTGDEADPFAASRDLTMAAAAAGEVPVLTVYNRPGRDCGLFSSGGARDADEYVEWLGSLAAGIGKREAVVILEPDAVPQVLEGCEGTDPDETYALLAQGVDILQRQPGVHVYLDAGNASWVEDLDALAGALRASGVERADGFALNVSNFETTERSYEYGTQLSDRLDGAHFVIDVSRNGAGPPENSGDAPDHLDWCNPEGMRLGEPPTTDTGLERVDALLWVKQPGDSDGDCGPGDPPAGTFDLGLAGGLLDQPLPG